MVEMVSKETSNWWWFASHKTSRKSPWLQSTLAELDEKTNAMLKLIEEDADSFAQRAEMYYKKRPELISLVEDFYRAYRSLAERYDQVKSDPGTRLLTTLGSPFASTNHQSEKFTLVDHNFDSYSEGFDAEDYAESEVEDPEQENETQVDKGIEETVDLEQEDETQVDQEMKEDEVSSEVCSDGVMKLREEIEKLKEENMILTDQLMQKEEEKIMKEDEVSSEVCDDEVIRLTEEIERLKEENKIQRDQLMQKDEEKEEMKEDEVSSEVYDDEVMRLREEIERLKDENKVQRDQLMQKVLRLREEIERLKEENKIQRDQLMEKKKEMEEHQISSEVCEGEMMRLREEIESLKDENMIQRDQLKDAERELDEVCKEVNRLWDRIMGLKKENKIQNDQLIQKDEEKREAIRQLSLAIVFLKDENVSLRKCFSKDYQKKWSPVEFSKLKAEILGKIFKRSLKSQVSVVAL